MLKEGKKRERSNKSQRCDDHPEQIYKVNERAESMQVTLMVKLPTPMIHQTGPIDQKNMHSDNEVNYV